LIEKELDMSEREFSAGEALAKIIDAIGSLGLNHTIHMSNTSGLIATAILTDKSGNILSEGAGKGPLCDIGALAESIEHLCASGDIAQQATRIKSRELLQQKFTIVDEVIANLPNKDLSIPCLPFYNIYESMKIYVPAALVSTNRDLLESTMNCPDTNFLARYSTNSGTAFGCSFNEAILHGLNEVIERHTLSYLLMSACKQSLKQCTYTPSPALMDLARMELNDGSIDTSWMKILIIESTTGAFFSIALPRETKSQFILCPIGSGCSISPVTAVTRSITELIQVTALYDESERELDDITYDLLDSHDLLRSLITLAEFRTDDCTAWSNSTNIHPLTIEEQIKKIVTGLMRTGHNTSYRILKEFNNGCVVTQVYIPGMDRFNLIRAGSAVAPQHILRCSRTRLLSNEPLST
jgi:ribosomal protein S12 methylthiotransferase accessory factor